PGLRGPPQAGPADLALPAHAVGVPEVSRKPRWDRKAAGRRRVPVDPSVAPGPGPRIGAEPRRPRGKGRDPGLRLQGEDPADLAHVHVRAVAVPEPIELGRPPPLGFSD